MYSAMGGNLLRSGPDWRVRVIIKRGKKRPDSVAIRPRTFHRADSMTNVSDLHGMFTTAGLFPANHPPGQQGIMTSWTVVVSVNLSALYSVESHSTQSIGKAPCIICLGHSYL